MVFEILGIGFIIILKEVGLLTHSVFLSCTRTKIVCSLISPVVNPACGVFEKEVSFDIPRLFGSFASISEV